MQDLPKDWQGKLFTSMLEGEQYTATSNLIREAGNVNAVYQGCAERAIQTLLWFNGGGAVTILAYIYNLSECSINFFVKISLVVFLCGLILAFYVVARDFEWAKNESQKFHGDVNSFILGEIPFSSIRRFQPKTVLIDKQVKLTLIFGELSAGCAVWGTAFGLLGYF